jgi:rhodanese-related sulfurtransferase
MSHSSKFMEIVNASKKNIKELDVTDLKKKFDDNHVMHLIDTREDNEWAKGYILGATHLGKGVLERDIEGLVPNAGDEIILYCGGGYRSALAAEALQNMGYTNVYSMDGGYKAWKNADYPLGGI